MACRLEFGIIYEIKEVDIKLIETLEGNCIETNMCQLCLADTEYSDGDYSVVLSLKGFGRLVEFFTPVYVDTELPLCMGDIYVIFENFCRQYGLVFKAPGYIMTCEDDT